MDGYFYATFDGTGYPEGASVNGRVTGLTPLSNHSFSISARNGVNQHCLAQNDCDWSDAVHNVVQLPDTPDAPDKDGNHAKVFEYGDPNLSRASSKGKASSRICVDCFLDRCCEHWTLLEILEEDQILQAFGSWDANGDGNIELDEFVQMISHANPDVKQAKITRAFAAASGSGDYVDKSRLATALLTHGLQLVDKPKDGDNQASGPGPEGETFTPPPAGAAE